MRSLVVLLLAWSVLPVLAQDEPPAPPPALVQVYGQVDDSLTGKPVYECLVGYYGRDGVRHGITPVNSDGRYSLFVPAGIPFQLGVEQENGYHDLRMAMPAITPGADATRQDLRLRPKP